MSERLDHPIRSAYGMYFHSAVDAAWAGNATYRVIIRTPEIVVLDVAEYDRLRAIAESVVNNVTGGPGSVVSLDEDDQC